MKARAQWHEKTRAAVDDHNFLPTQPEITSAVVRAEYRYLQRYPVIWEPCCGQGHMSKVLSESGFDVVSTDLVDRGYGLGGVNFLECRTAPARAIFTNPPYCDGLPEKFLRHAALLDVSYVGMLLKVQFFNTQISTQLWRDFRPVREYKIGWRPDFLGLGGGQMDCCFWVWDLTRQPKFTKTFVLTKEGECL